MKRTKKILEQIIRIRELHDEKFSPTEIAKELGVDRTNIYYWIKNLDKLPKKQEPNFCKDCGKKIGSDKVRCRKDYDSSRKEALTETKKEKTTVEHKPQSIFHKDVPFRRLSQSILSKQQQAQCNHLYPRGSRKCFRCGAMK